MASLAHPVEPARGGPVTDLILDQLIDIAARLPQQMISDAEGSLLVMAMPGCLQELQDYRNRARLAASILNPANVISFPGRV
jgi:hypothetical protein